MIQDTYSYTAIVMKDFLEDTENEGLKGVLATFPAEVWHPMSRPGRFSLSSALQVLEPIFDMVGDPLDRREGSL